MDKALLSLILVLCSAFSVSKDLTWQPNSNWELDDNWKLTRQPCSGDTVRFEEASRPSTVRLSSDVTVRGVVMPKSGSFKLVLGANGRIRLSNSTQCGSAAATVVAIAGDNVFVGARDNFWECPENWKTADGDIPKTAPCGDDTAVFPEDSSFSFVTSNSSKTLNVAAVRLRGKMVTDFKNYSNEFPSLNVVIQPGCLTNSMLCECPEIPKTCKAQPSVAPPNTGGLEGSNSGGIVAGVVVVVIVVVVIVVLVIVAVVWWMKSGRSASFHPYHKETLDEPAVTFSKDEEAAVNFDNPMFDTTSDFDELVGAEELPEPTVTVAAKGGGERYDDDLPEKRPL